MPQCSQHQKRPPVAASFMSAEPHFSEHNTRKVRSGHSRALAVAAAVLAAVLAPLPNARADDAAAIKEKIEAGETVYNTRCAVCHGDDLVNTGQTFDLRRLRADERPRFENSVRNGKNQMPPWKDVLSDDDIDHLWYYVRAHAFQK
jgi:mono/diheme cytochrome c family protein